MTVYVFFQMFGPAIKVDLGAILENLMLGFYEPFAHDTQLQSNER